MFLVPSVSRFSLSAIQSLVRESVLISRTFGDLSLMWQLDMMVKSGNESCEFSSLSLSFSDAVTMSCTRQPALSTSQPGGFAMPSYRQDVQMPEGWIKDQGMTLVDNNNWIKCQIWGRGFCSNTEQMWMLEGQIWKGRQQVCGVSSSSAEDLWCCVKTFRQEVMEIRGSHSGCAWTFPSFCLTFRTCFKSILCFSFFKVLFFNGWIPEANISSFSSYSQGFFRSCPVSLVSDHRVFWLISEFHQAVVFRLSLGAFLISSLHFW